MKGTPQALLACLQRLGVIPDGLGECYISPQQARAIRQSGYSANGNRMWYCPILPDAIVRDTLYSHISDALPRAYGYGPGQWRAYRAHLEGDRRSAYAHIHKAIQPDGSRAYCPLCKRAHVRSTDNADTHTHADVVISNLRVHLAAAARALGYTLQPADTTPPRR
jgi:hypothetical protein